MTSKNKLLIFVGGLFLAVFVVGAGIFLYKSIFSEEVKGRIMVVQRDAEVKRLALVKVFAVTAKTLTLGAP